MNNDDFRLVLFLLSEIAAARMRELVSRCTVMEVFARDQDLYFFCRQRKLRTAAYSGGEIAETAFDLLKRNYH